MTKILLMLLLLPFAGKGEDFIRNYYYKIFVDDNYHKIIQHNFTINSSGKWEIEAKYLYVDTVLPEKVKGNYYVTEIYKEDILEELKWENNLKSLNDTVYILKLPGSITSYYIDTSSNVYMQVINLNIPDKGLVIDSTMREFDSNHNVLKSVSASEVQNLTIKDVKYTSINRIISTYSYKDNVLIEKNNKYIRMDQSIAFEERESYSYYENQLPKQIMKSIKKIDGQFEDYFKIEYSYQ